MTKDSLRLFVAMPGTKMGSAAEWSDPEQIKKHFFEKIKEGLDERLGQQIELVIEKDKVLAGPIHASMFQEAMKADIYISDLTGNNANVYLELGVRWALSDAVTVVVSQNVSDILFNAAASRAIPYGKDPDSLQAAIDKAIKAILEGLETPNYCDSPVRQGAKIVTLERDYVEGLKAKINKLNKQRGEDLFAAAAGASTSDERLRLLRDAVDINPSRIDILIELGAELRKQAKYEDSVSYLQRATRIDPESAEAHRELGLTYGKLKNTERAIQEHKEAIRINPNHAESLRNCGGEMRRWAMRNAPGKIDWSALKEARDLYDRAGELEPHDTYALLNVAKLELFLSKNEPSRLQVSQNQFETLKDLCKFEVGRNPKDSWRKFDLAESYLFSAKFDNDFDRAAELYAEAIDSVPEKHRVSVLTSVMGPFNELLTLDIFAGDLQANTERIRDLLKENIEACGGQ